MTDHDVWQNDTTPNEVHRAWIDGVNDNAPLPLSVVTDDFDAINPAAIDYIADALMLLTAELVATLINAGSEREAVVENEELRNAIVAELTGWSTPTD
jgi:hypothetical protein